MTKQQRKHLVETLSLGCALTFLVMAMDSVGWLSLVENVLYDQRVRTHQNFTPKPTDKLVHVDIDDASLEDIGFWPWPRAKLARVLDELKLAGAKVVALDIIMPEPQEPTSSKDAPAETIDHDAVLARSIHDFGRVLVPVSFKFGKPERPGALADAIARELSRNLQTEWESVEAKLRGDFPSIVIEDFLAVRRDLVGRRIEQELRDRPYSLEEMYARILPDRSASTEIGLLNQIESRYRVARSKREIERFAKVIRKPLPYVLAPTDELLMIPPLAEAAAYSGFVDHLPYSDGVERTTPMWVMYRGRLFPQMGLALACATIGVPIERVQVFDDRMVIPRPEGGHTVVPLHTYRSKKLGQEVGALMDVPWFGGDSWETMYGPSQHYSIRNLWQMAEARQAARKNNVEADAAMLNFAEDMGVDAARKFLKSPPDPSVIDSRIEAARKTLEEYDDFAGDEVKKVRQKKAAGSTLELKETQLLAAYDALVTVVRENSKLAQQQARLRREFEGKSVLIGSVSTSAFDFVTTPLFARCPGVVVHGVIFNAIIQNYIWHRAPGWVTAIATIAVGLVATFVVALLPPWKALVSTAALIGSYLLFNGFLVFDYFHTILGLAGPVVAAGTVWAVITLMQYIAERRARRFITRRFEAYAAKKLVDYVLLNPEQNVFAGQEREMSCVFTDMQGFTSLMERLGSGIVPALNEYMGRMTPIIEDNNGLLNKFLGDGIMFFYGAPEPDPHHAPNAVKTVLEMQHVGIPAFNNWLKEQGLDLQVSVRAGITTGPMIVGDAGSERRTDYTVLGDAVNLSARLESANKYLGTKSMVTERTVALCNGQFLFRPVARIQVVGKSQSVTAFEPMAYAADATDEQKRLAEATRSIVDAFVAGRFDQCIKLADEAQKEFGPSKLFALYMKNCEEHMQLMPVDFDGRIVLAEK